MPLRRSPDVFYCEGCNQTIVKAPSPARDLRTRYCSARCKYSAWVKRRNKAGTICSRCGTALPNTHYLNKYCAQCGPIARADLYAVKPKKGRTLRQSACVVCSASFASVVPRVTCGSVCRAILQSQRCTGKKYRLPPQNERSCTVCGTTFMAKRATRCGTCSRRESPRKYSDRARKFGVVYERGLSREKVFIRDRWRCQLCGARTPQKLQGLNTPKSPELDHIVPLSRGGGHTWDNVQCACRSCNIRKAATIRGQLRIPLSADT